MLHHVDLRPILADPAAAEILLLARGQLNRAFRTHGLIPPDPLSLSEAEAVDPAELDDPAAQGIDLAMAKFQDSFLAWAGAMPVKLVPPVLDILQQAQRALAQPQGDDSAACVAVRRAYEFLQGCVQPDQEASDCA